MYWRVERGGGDEAKAKKAGMTLLVFCCLSTALGQVYCIPYSFTKACPLGSL